MLSQHTTQLNLFPSEQTKCCTKCGKIKPLAEFARREKGNEKRRSHCHACLRESERARRMITRDHQRSLRRAYYAANAEKKLAQARTYQESHRDKIRARNALGHAVRIGKLPPASAHFCFTCGTSVDMGGKMEYHHPNYARPFEVIPLCNSCHQLLHVWGGVNP